jgi:hypothetical protein
MFNYANKIAITSFNGIILHTHNMYYDYKCGRKRFR